MSKTLVSSDIDHKRIKHLATDNGVSIMKMINIIVDGYKELQMLKQSDKRVAS